MPEVLGRVLTGGRSICGAKTSVFSLIPNGVEMSFVTASFISMFPEKLIKSNEANIYFVVVRAEDEPPQEFCAGIVAKFGAVNDLIVLGVMQTRPRTSGRRSRRRSSR